VRRYMPELIDLVLSGTTTPRKVFDQTLPLVQVAEDYRAIDERRDQGPADAVDRLKEPPRW
jgi:hypothetical protein